LYSRKTRQMVANWTSPRARAGILLAGAPDGRGQVPVSAVRAQHHDHTRTQVAGHVKGRGHRRPRRRADQEPGLARQAPGRLVGHIGPHWNLAVVHGGIIDTWDDRRGHVLEPLQTVDGAVW